MKILLDGRTIDESVTDDATLETTLRRVQDVHCPPSRLVVGIRCDDREVSGNDMNAKLGEPSATVEKLEVFTSTRQELVISALGQASSTLGETEAVCRRAGELLNEGKAAEGIKTLGTCLTVWQQVHEAITNSLSMLEIDVESMTIRDEPLLDVLARPRDVLVQLKEALTAQDHVLLADVLQYEFGNATDQWYAVIAAIRQVAEDQREEIERNEATDRTTGDG